MTAPLSDPSATGDAAPFGRRAFARLFDIAVVGVVAVPVLTLTLRDDNDGGVRFPLVVIVLYALIPTLLEARVLVRSGATPGKRLSGLRVERGAAQAPPGWAAAVVRTVVSWAVPALAVLLLDRPVVAAVLLVVYGPAVIPGVRRDLPDLLAGTRVVFIGDVTDDAPEIDPEMDPEIDPDGEVPPPPA